MAGSRGMIVRTVRTVRSFGSFKRVWGPALAGPSVALLITLVIPAIVSAQGRGGGQAGGAQQSGRAGAIKDLTGYWVSVVAEHWHLRMMVPPKGDVTMLPVNAEGRRITNTWDPAKDEAAGEACRSYGAPTIMRVPGRLHITWVDDTTLKIDTDAGTQTRLLHFEAGRAGEAGRASAAAEIGRAHV